jgi:hypothetical protein
MIGAVVIGTQSTFVISAYVLPDRPERVLSATILALPAIGSEHTPEGPS